jgi:tetratricopeptide (TPR) repeat protein
VSGWRPAVPARRTILVAAAAVLLTAALGAGAWVWSSMSARQAAEAYDQAFALLPATRAPQAPAAARTVAATALEAVIARYPSARPAAHAAWELGHLRRADGKLAEARAAYQIARDRATTSTTRTLAGASLAATWEAEAKPAEAAEAYRAALAGLTPRDFLHDDLTLALGRALEQAGKKDEAVAAYRALLKESPTSRRAEDVRIRLASLGATAQ